MQIKKTLLATATAAAAANAQTVNLVVKSGSKEIDGNTIGFKHEGAGMDYAFLGTSAQSQLLDYDATSKSLTYNAQYPYSFNVDKYVSLTVGGSNSEITFNSENTLLVNGTSSGFYACKNTNDPYQYSKYSYELMYYKTEAPLDCIALNLANGQNSTSPNSTTSSSLSSYEDSGAMLAPAGAFAVLFGAAAALI